MKGHKVSLKAGDRAAFACALAQQFLIFYGLACTGISLFYEAERPELYRWLLLLFVPVVYLALVRKLVRIFVLSLFLQLPVVFTAVFAGRDFGQKSVICVCTVMMTALSIEMRSMEKGSFRECPSIKMISVLLLCYVVSLIWKHPVCARCIYMEVPVYILLHFMYESLANMAAFIRMNRKMENFPVGQMVVINRMMVVFLLVVTAAGMVLVPMLHLEIFVIPVLEGLSALVLWLFSFIHPPEGELITGREIRAAQGFWDDLRYLGRKNGGNGAVWAAVERLLEFAVVFFLAALVIGGTAYLLYRLYKGYYADGKEGADEKEFLVGDLKKLVDFPARLQKREPEEKGTRNQRIRREYRRFVKRAFKKKEIDLSALTPQETLSLIGEQIPDGGMEVKTQERIREIYEKARYGRQESEQMELEEIRELIKRADKE